MHERFTEVAGSEKVVKELAVQWPDAAVHATIWQEAGVPAGLSAPVQATWLQSLYRGLGNRSYAPLLPLMPLAFRTMPLRDADVVIASHHAFATQAVFSTQAPVVAYVHSPARWAWDPALRATEGGGMAGSAILSVLARLAKKRELAAAPHLTKVVANSSAVAQRISQWWQRSAVVVHPPVDTDAYTPDPHTDKGDYFLVAGRMVPYKRPDLAVRAAKQAGVRLIVAGDGRMMAACRALAAPDTTFVGYTSQEEMLKLYRGARALLMPGLEDFGIVPVEVMATGTPVIALGAGGALDTVIPGITGQLVAPGTDDDIVDGFASALRSFDASEYDPVAIRNWAQRFSPAEFRLKMKAIVDEVS